MRQRQALGLMARAERVLGSVKVLPDYISLTGGLDEVTPPYRRKPGFLRSAQNYEADIHGGYRRIPGYERLDGRTKPSNGVYAILNATITGSFAAGNTVTGGTSAATGVVLAVVTSVTPNYLVLTKLTGTFQNAEALKVAAVTQGTSSSTATIGGASTPLLNATYLNLAADSYRADIGAIPGSGNTLGVFEHLDVQYGFRNDAGGTAAALYKATVSGWTLVSLGEEIGFTNANTGVGDSDTLTQGGVTATIGRVVVQTGSLASGVNTGRLIISGRGGGNFAAGAATSTGAGALTLSAIQTAITLLPGGSYEFWKENFGGLQTTTRVYGCDGVNRGFEFDGTVFVPIVTGMTLDAPNHVYAHKKQLFFAFLGSVQHAAPGTPYVWSPITGASEIAMGDNVTGFSGQPGSNIGGSTSGALAIFSRNRLSILYGNGVSDWNLQPYRNEVGAFSKTVQDIGYPMFLDDRGITDLQASQAYGNFAHNAISEQIRDTMNTLRLSACASCISRDRSQYRLFATTGQAIYVTAIGKKIIGITPMLFPDVVRCVYSGEQTNGTEVIYFGSANGYVYQMEKGTSFDGANIEAYLNLAYNFQGAPRVNKQYRDATLEISGSAYTAFSLGYSLGYGSTDIPQPDAQSVVSNFSAVNWDSFTWDAFTWDGSTLMPNNIDLGAEAENISLAVTSSSDIYAAFTITSALIHYSQRGRLRP